MDESIRVLVVDDEPGLAELTGTFLERADETFEIETAMSARAGLDVLDPEIDCIVSDYDMPEVDGLDFLEAVRSRYPELPFILFTGKGSEEIASKAITAGVTDYLQKERATEQYTVLANRVRNVVERCHSVRALRESQRRLSLLFEQSPFGVIEWNDDLEFVALNETATGILGYEEADLVGESWEVVVPPAQREFVERQFEIAIESADGSEMVNRNVRADGTYITCAWHNSAVTDDEGNIINLFSQFRDVTDERTDRRRLEALIDRLPGFVYQVENEPPWTATFIRGSCQELTGYTGEEFIDSDVSLGNLVHPDDQASVNQQIENTLEEGDSFDLFYRLVRRDGTVRRVWERGRLVDDPLEDGDLLEGVAIDVTPVDEVGFGKGSVDRE